MTHLCHIHIGPVQSFIASGRRTQDLLVGSWLLSELARAGVEAARAAHADLLYPAVVNGSLPESVPNLFAFLTEDEPNGICEYVEEQIRGRWREIAGGVKAWLSRRAVQDAQTPDRWEDVFDRQIETWMEVYWVAVHYDERNHSRSFNTVKRAMAQRKNARHFPQIDEPGWKCTLTGAGQALPLDWSRLSSQVGDKELRPNERLGALALIKRFAVDARVLSISEPFPSTEDIAGLREEDKTDKQRGKELEGYFAILAMDGDRMGPKLSGLKSGNAHRAFSAALAEFADKTVPDIISHYDAEAKSNKHGRAALVYAGGDDVLALLPLRYAIPCADTIRRKYAEKLSGMVDSPTMSAGIAVVPSNYPLDIALSLARSAERSAKHDYGRDAVVVTEAHGTQQRTAGARWALYEEDEKHDQDRKELDSIAALVSELIQAFSKPARLSAKIGYDLSEMAYALVVKPKEDTDGKETVNVFIPPEARAAEVRRLLKRRSESLVGSKETQKVVDDLAPRLCGWGDHKYRTREDVEIVGWESLANWVILARFLASGGKEQS
ncbi:MAG: hypothetical protein BroJett033_6980 [Chloroflexota bacterium]|nr:MAG: hypothetical protein BroJett033_6980 [Chloroflexota bacterium]